MAIYLFHVNDWKYFEFSDGSIIGRSRGDLTYPKDGLMSGSHLKLSISDETNAKVFIEDLNSKNGTLLNREAIPANQKIEFPIHTLLEVGFQKFILTQSPDLKVDFVNRLLNVHKEKPELDLETAHHVVEKFRKDKHDKLHQLEEDEKKARNTIIELNKEIAKFQVSLHDFKSIKHQENKKSEAEKEIIQESLEAEKAEFLKNLDIKRQEAFRKIESQKSRALIEAEKMIQNISEKINQLKNQIIELDDKAQNLQKEAMAKKKRMDRYAKAQKD